MFIPWVRGLIKMYLRFKSGTQRQPAPGLCGITNRKLLSCFDNLHCAQHRDVNQTYLSISFHNYLFSLEIFLLSPPCNWTEAQDPTWSGLKLSSIYNNFHPTVLIPQFILPKGRSYVTSLFKLPLSSFSEYKGIVFWVASPHSHTRVISTTHLNRLPQFLIQVRSWQWNWDNDSSHAWNRSDCHWESHPGSHSPGCNEDVALEPYTAGAWMWDKTHPRRLIDYFQLNSYSAFENDSGQSGW